jgi:hypothetical protein
MSKDKKEVLFDEMSDDLYDLLKLNHAMIAGGAITSVYTGNEINDYDVYFKTEKDMESFLRSSWASGNFRVCSKRAISFKDYCGGNKMVQVVTLKAYPTPQSIFESFDFTINMGLYDFDEDKFIVDDNFIADNLKRCLNYNVKTPYPLTSLKRMEKYRQRGYSIPTSTLYKIGLSMKNVNIESYDALSEQIGGMYGEESEDIFEEIRDEPFDINRAMELFEEKQGQSNCINFFTKYCINYNLLVSYCLGKQIYWTVENDNIMERFVLFDDNFYSSYFFNDSAKRDIMIKRLNAIEKQVPCNFPLRFVKYVKIDGDKYVSFYDNSFEYKEGEYYNNIYGSSIIGAPHSTYSCNKDRAFVFMHVNKRADMNISPFSALNKTGILFNEIYIDKIVPLADGEKYPEGIFESTPAYGAWNFDDMKGE